MEHVTEARLLLIPKILEYIAVKTVCFETSRFIDKPIKSVKLFSNYCVDKPSVMNIDSAKDRYPIQLVLFLT